MNLRQFAIALLVGVLVFAPLPASACPLCKEAISTSDNPEEVNNMPAAYNNSIYMMIAVPYLSLGLLSFGVYRGLKKNAAYFENLQSPADDAANDESGR
jgi:hypothetical protein